MRRLPRIKTSENNHDANKWYRDEKDDGVRYVVSRHIEYFFLPGFPYKFEMPGRVFYFNDEEHIYQEIAQADNEQDAKIKTLAHLETLENLDW